ncbi:MAG: DUF808 domain-containing protein [Pseudomonadota bacterium]
MSGLLALLDDVAAIAKLAAAQADDISAQAMKAGSKAAGVVIDDAAVTPKYVVGLPAARELPIIWKIARGSLINKLVILLPIALLLDAFAPWALTPLLMLGGCYLCYEGAHKILSISVAKKAAAKATKPFQTAAQLEETKVKGAIKTDFILSAEIMAIALSEISAETTWQSAFVLAVVGVVITIGVYGVVAIIVRADDWGLKLEQVARTQLGRRIGRTIVQVVPFILQALAIIGTAAMLWVGGNILVHGAANLGWADPEHVIHDVAHVATDKAFPGAGFVGWLIIASLNAVVGLAIGFVITKVLELRSGHGSETTSH